MIGRAEVMRDQTTAEETIFALSSGSLPSGVAVVRISGPQSAMVLRTLCGSVPEPRHATLSAVYDLEGGLIDKGICLFFPGPASFTGEDSAELQVHGGKAVVAKLLQTLTSFAGLRLAEAGEFTRRAFLNGKLDLANAEALSDLISAETEAQRRFAITNTTDKHRQLYDGWRQKLIQARAMLEAEIDFTDEADVPDSISARAWAEVKTLREEIANHLASYRSAEIIRDGLQVVILGAPNAGKSSLLNALAQREVAIVTEEAGTTRDVLEIQMDLAGLKVILADTAGIRETSSHIEKIGIQRSLSRAQSADLIIELVDLANPTSIDHKSDRPIISVGSKWDLLRSCPAKQFDCVISTHTSEGIKELLELISAHAQRYGEQATSILPFRERHKVLLEECLGELDHAENEQYLELAAERMRRGSDALVRICGRIDVEDLLDTIFGTFCIGK